MFWDLAELKETYKLPGPIWRVRMAQDLALQHINDMFYFLFPCILFLPKNHL
jgi:hypothetical protein